MSRGRDLIRGRDLLRGRDLPRGRGSPLDEGSPADVSCPADVICLRRRDLPPRTALPFALELVRGRLDLCELTQELRPS